MNLTLELTTDQIVDFIQKMPPEEKRAVLLALAEQAEANRAARMDYAEAQFRKLCASRELDWDTMTGVERENFVDDLICRETSLKHIPNSVVIELKNYRNHHYKDDINELPKKIRDEVYTNPFAFLIGAAFDRGMDWKQAWEIPYQIKLLGKLDPSILASMTEKELSLLLESLPRKPRYGIRIGAKTLKDAASLVRDHFGGDTAAIWRDASPTEVKKRLQSIHGVGQGIASMAVRMLHDKWGMFTGQEHQIDIKADVHVIRVFQRTGLTHSKAEEEATSAARRLNPKFPGELDWAAWKIGKNWCFPTKPQCNSCPLTAVCGKHIK